MLKCDLLCIIASTNVIMCLLSPLWARIPGYAIAVWWIGEGVGIKPWARCTVASAALFTMFFLGIMYILLIASQSV